MNNIWTRRIGAAAGAIFVLIALLHGDGGNQPGFHASRRSIVAWIHTDSTITASHYAMAFLELLAFLCLLVFITYLASVLRRTEGDVGYLSTTVLSAGILSIAIKLASFPATVAAYVWAKDGVDPRVIGML